jgi:3-oxoacyl-[acyl-carrier protein] reductase
MSVNGGEFSGELALVTGASRGIGQAVALDLAQGGAEVYGTATTAEGALSISRMFNEADLYGHGVELNIGHTI